MFDFTKVFAAPDQAIKNIIEFNTDMFKTVVAAQTKLANDLYAKWIEASATNK